MSARGAHVIAADVDERFLNYIEEKKIKIGDSLVTLRKTEYDDPLLEDEEVDHVIIVNTYHHIEDRISYFKKMTNGLKEDGLLMVVDYKKKETAHGPPEAHRMPLTTVIIELKKVGYYNFKIYEDMLEDQYIILAQKPSI
jgi:ubiquinone/menaquinone biosynthesis C-methylase UbiE